jgi:hypothetical protein
LAKDRKTISVQEIEGVLNTGWVNLLRCDAGEAK